MSHTATKNPIPVSVVRKPPENVLLHVVMLSKLFLVSHLFGSGAQWHINGTSCEDRFSRLGIGQFQQELYIIYII